MTRGQLLRGLPENVQNIKTVITVFRSRWFYDYRYFSTKSAYIC